MTATANEIQFYDYNPQLSCFADEVINGLNQHPRRIPPKFFYDQRGSQIFDAICETEEYYVTRTEIDILTTHRDEITDLIGSGCLLVEPGSGSSQKVRVLLEVLRPHAYLPLDISRDYLQHAAQELADEYPWLEVHAACIDYTKPIDLCFAPKQPRKVAFFPGSSIGNFEPDQAISFLRNIANMVQPNGGLLIGVDLKKDPEVLNAAYNDSEGITADFNLNLLGRINRELNANFDVNKFFHQAHYNSKQGRIEMHLVAQESQTVDIHSQSFHFKAGDSIHTENSYKYHLEEFQALARSAGFQPIRTWTDPDNLFSVHFLEVKP
jgi:dimethylhistidine N-methyltransferase